MTESTGGSTVCKYCGLKHGDMLCPDIKAIEYHPNGAIKRIEFHEYTTLDCIGVQGGKASLASLSPYRPGYADAIDKGSLIYESTIEGYQWIKTITIT